MTTHAGTGVEFTLGGRRLFGKEPVAPIFGELGLPPEADMMEAYAVASLMVTQSGYHINHVGNRNLEVPEQNPGDRYC